MRPPGAQPPLRGRQVVEPDIGGVDVTPVIWVGLISLLRELVVGQQGLLTQVLRQSQSIV